MWLQASTDAMPVGMRPAPARGVRALAGGRGLASGRQRFASLWFGASPSVIGGTLLAVAVLLLAACSSGPPAKETESSSQPVGATSGTAAGKSGSAAPGSAAGANGAAGGANASGAAAVPVTARGKADFERAVGAMKAGNTTEAELEFKQVALQFPQLSAPYVNLGILYRKTGRLDQSEEALKTAVEHNDGSAVAWTELGATQRLRGEFPSAAASYEKAITADPNFAPAYRNLGVVSDLYLGDPERALTAFERYKELTGEEKPVSGWIAELRQRTGKPPLKRPAPKPAPGAAEGSGSPDNGSSGAAGVSDGAQAAPGAAASGASASGPGASGAGAAGASAPGGAAGGASPGGSDGAATGVPNGTASGATSAANSGAGSGAARPPTNAATPGSAKGGATPTAPQTSPAKPASPNKGGN